MRVVHLSDSHQFLSQDFPLPDGDVLVHTGDFTNNGSVEEFKKFNDWLGLIKHKFKAIIVCLGNHDVYVWKDSWSKMKSLLSNATYVPIFEMIEIEGIKFYGCPWHYWQTWHYKNKITTNEKTKFDTIPSGVDILLTHGPRKGVLDFADGWMESGSQELLSRINTVKPRVHLHGHIHESAGNIYSNSILTLNSALVDWKTTKIVNQPQVFDIDETSVKLIS